MAAIGSSIQSTAYDNRLSGSWAEFDQLMSRSWRRAYNMAYQLTRNRTDAEDLVQDTYLKAWRAFSRYRPERPFINWVLRIMQRAFLDVRRRNNPVRNAESLNSMISPTDGEAQEIPIADVSMGPDELVMTEELVGQVHKALNRVPDAYRSAVMLCDIEGMSYLEIAEIQNTTVGTVRSRIHRGRQMLRKELEKQEAGH
jgi:RNA polymerase sigma-70 factor, ECF subfamily